MGGGPPGGYGMGYGRGAPGPGAWNAGRGRPGDRGGSAGKFETRSGWTRPGDWKCLECENVNFSWRDKCNKCEEPKGEAKAVDDRDDGQ